MTHFRRARRRPDRQRWPDRDRRPPRGWLARLARGLVTSSLASALVLAVAGCSGAAGQVQLPPRSADATPTAIVQRAPTQRQRVLAAFAGYTAALHAADLSGNATLARRLLRPYLAAPRIRGVVQTERGIWAKGERFYGQPVQHVLSVRVDGRHAFVHNCDNTSAMGLQSAATRLPVPGTGGVPDANIITRLNLVRGHWIVSFQLIEDVPCHA
jgi:hypothetical protein